MSALNADQFAPVEASILPEVLFEQLTRTCQSGLVSERIQLGS
jgi:hypothetical protein